MAGVYVWALLKWLNAREFPSALTTYRSWKVNFGAFWVYIGLTVLNMLCSVWLGGNFIVASVPYIGLALGALLLSGGIFLSWRIKQLWLVYDPERSLAYEPFDYFIWEDEEPEEDPKDEKETAIVEDVVDPDTTNDKTDNTNSSETTNTEDGSTNNGNNDSSSTTTTGGTSSTGDSTSGGSSTGGSTSEGSSTGGSTTSGGNSN